MSAQHTPGRQCVECDGFCLRAATIDEANTALAIAKTREERLYACEALEEAARITAAALRVAPTRAIGMKSEHGAAPYSTPANH